MKNETLIYLCDDSDEFINIMEEKINCIFLSREKLYVLHTYLDGAALLDAFSRSEADIVLLDIEMPNMSGFETAEKLQKINPRANIVFITSHDDMVYQSYEYHPFWFVRKSHLEDLAIVLDRLLSKLDAESKERVRIAKLISGEKAFEIDIKEALYIQACGHYVIVKNCDGSAKQLRCKISDAERQLSEFDFVRIQNGIIVNCRFITKVTSKKVVLRRKDEFNISRERSEYVLASYMKYVRCKL